MTEKIYALLLAFALFALVFGAIDRFRPREKRLRLVRRGFLTDLTYWFFTPIIGEAIKRAALILVMIPVAYVVWNRVDAADIMRGFGPLSELPYFIQVMLMLVIGDVFGYWMHRFFHRGRAWKFHAIHHSSVELDWLSSVRMHPLNEAVMAVVTFTPLLLLGFAPAAFAGVAPVVTVFAILVHANVDWDWGPLRTVLVSPRFHRWHHSDEPEAIGKNFAGLFPVWDILFGTYYMPRDRAPASFGAGAPIPQGLWGQLRYPFVTSK